MMSRPKSTYVLWLVAAAIGIFVGAAFPNGCKWTTTPKNQVVPYMISYSWNVPGHADFGFGYTVVRPGYSPDGMTESDLREAQTLAGKAVTDQKDSGLEKGKSVKIVILGCTRLKP